MASLMGRTCAAGHLHRERSHVSQIPKSTHDHLNLLWRSLQPVRAVYDHKSQSDFGYKWSPPEAPLEVVFLKPMCVHLENSLFGSGCHPEYLPCLIGEWFADFESSF